MVNLVSTTLYLALHIAFLYVEIELQMPAHVHVKKFMHPCRHPWE